MCRTTSLNYEIYMNTLYPIHLKILRLSLIYALMSVYPELDE